jgi:O-antigen/teichoic acid export membrane protein
MLASAAYMIGLIPIVLYFTSVPELGLWTLVVQFTTYLGLVDAGVNTSCVRRFVGPIARKEISALGTVFKTAFIVSLIQGSFCCLLAFLAHPIGILLGIGPEELSIFSSVLFVQFLLVGLFFLARPFSSLLLAAQRYEINNLVSSVSILFSLAIIWVGLRYGLGLWALPLSYCFQQVCSSFTTFLMIRKLDLLPASWWQQESTWKELSNLFMEALDYFSWSGFSMAGSAVQSIFLSRFLGLEVVAIWNVGSKVSSFAYMLFGNMFNTAFMGLSELFERGDPKKCLASFLSLFLFSWTSLLIFAAFALFCNGIFVSLWTHKQIAFPMACTWVIFTWLILASLIRALACFSNVWQHRTTMRISPILEFSSLCVFLGVSLLSPSLFFFSLALAASQIPPLFLSYGPFILAAGKILEIHLSKNQWGMIFTAVISFFIAILTLLMPVSLIPAILIISFSALPWIYFFSRELRSGALTPYKSVLI